MRRLIRKFKSWLRDKWNWLLTFNKPPKVTINQDLVAYEGDTPAVIMDGRVIVQVNGNVTYKPLRGTLELTGHIKQKPTT